VNAEPEVGGLPTYGWTTGVTVDARGEVVSADGRLKEPVKGDTYPVLSAEKTLALLNAEPGGGRMGIGGCADPVPLKDRLEAPCEADGSAGSGSADGSGSATGSGSAEGSVGSAAPAGPTTVEKAVFGLAPHLVDGRQTLVPSWLFEVRAPGARDTYTVTRAAVDPKYVTTPTPSARPASPSPRTGDPGDGPTAAPAPKNVEVSGYTAEGRELTVTFVGGVCADYRTSVSESDGKVTVRVTETPWPDKVCIMIAKEYQETVRLSGPLGGRKVVGQDGDAVPLHKAGARLPEAPGAQ
jgi:hypothetical protein